MQVKICGVRTVEAARACAASGADLAGLNFVPGVTRRVEPRDAAAVVAALGEVVPVGVFRDQGSVELRRIAALVGLRWVQLHGSESPDECAALRDHFRVIKALTADHDATAYAHAVDALLIDGRAPGSGTSWDYARLRRTTDPSSAVPVFLAGGLDPSNVAAAICAGRPDGVDVASGVETEGRQDPALIHAFVRAARAAEERLTT